MRTPPPILSDFFDHSRDRQSSINLSLMVIATQGIALVLIISAISILQKPTWPIRKLEMDILTAAAGGFFLIVWAVYCWSDLAQRFRQYKNPYDPLAKVPVAKRKTHLLRGTFGLIIADILLLAVLIGMTGGLGNSPLDPLLPAIPIIAIILRQPYRTIIWSLRSVLVAVTFFVVVRLPFVHHFVLKHVFEPHPLLRACIYNAHIDPNYHYALGLVAFGAIGLSLAEYWVANTTPEILKNIPHTVESVLGDRVYTAPLAREIRKGARNWVRWLSNRGLPLKDLSLVHDEHDVIKQAVVLCVPYWIDDLYSAPSGGWVISSICQWIIRTILIPILHSLKLDKLAVQAGTIVKLIILHQVQEPIRQGEELKRKRAIAREVTFLTLAAHWVDDHFDAIQANCPDPEERDNVLNQSPAQLLRGQHLRLNEVIYGMEKSARKENRIHVRNAVQRIIYGGLIQNAPSKARLNTLCSEYLAFVTHKLIREEQEAYRELSKRPLTMLLTAKVVMELLDSSSPCENSAKLIKRAEFFNLLYSPILYYHDWEREIAEEKYGAAFEGEDINNYLPKTEELIALVGRCKTLLPTVFGTSKLSTGRSVQLELLLQLYESQLPSALFNAYTDFLTSQGSEAYLVNSVVLNTSTEPGLENQDSLPDGTH